MPNYNIIAPGISIINDDSFGNYDKHIVHGLIKHVQDIFVEWIGVEGYGEKPVIVEYKEFCPTTFDFTPNIHQIKLHVQGNDYCRWVFQFAHEYCHHLINGQMTTAYLGLEWFEEVICHLSSLVHLRRLLIDYRSLGIHQTYQPQIGNWILANGGTPQNNVREYIGVNNHLLYREDVRRDIYDNIASSLIYLFESNPRLWRIILYFGNMKLWNSLEDLFTRLQETADDSYAESLSELKNMLIN